MQTKKIELKVNFNLKRILMWVLILFLFVPSIIKLFLGSTGLVKNLSLSEVITEIKQGKITTVPIRGDDIMRYYPKEEKWKE